MVQSVQWCVRWSCLTLICLAVVLHLVSLSVPRWVKMRVRPSGYRHVIALFAEQGMNVNPNTTTPHDVTDACISVGLWHWCADVTAHNGSMAMCQHLQLAELPNWWKGSQALNVVGLLMGLVSCMCAALEVHYSRRGVRFSGLAVMAAISSFVTALALSLSIGFYIARYINNSLALMNLPHLTAADSVAIFLPILDWGFGLGATAGALMGTTGVLLLAFVTRTYPTYHRTANVVV